MAFNILIADHSAIDRSLVMANLDYIQPDITYHESFTATDAIKMIKNYTYHCAFIADNLPDTEIRRFLDELRCAHSRQLPCAVIILGSRHDEKEITACIKNGAHDYIPKAHINSALLPVAMHKAREIFNLQNARLEAENKLVHSQKMEAVAQMASGLAHDFNNLLTIILGNTRLLKIGIPASNEQENGLLKKIDAIERAAARGTNLIKRLMIFSRQDGQAPDNLNLNEVIEDLGDLLNHALGETISIKSNLADNLAAVNIDRPQIENALINLCVNARDAMPDGGTLRIETANQYLDECAAGQIPDIAPGDYVMLAVSDTGSGIDQSVIEQIFDPFFTTKDIGRGTGLGLSTTYGVVRGAGGAIHVYSEKNKGTAFRIYLPQAGTAPFATVQDIWRAVSPENGHETILVVEDEDEIRELTCEYLSSLGYHILQAENGTKAMDIIAGGPAIDLLFTDIAMPGEMSGIQLAARALALGKYPDLKVIFTTGYTRESMPDYGLIEGHYETISKPYNHEHLAHRIRHILDENAALETV